MVLIVNIKYSEAQSLRSPYDMGRPSVTVCLSVCLSVTLLRFFAPYPEGWIFGNILRLGTWTVCIKILDKWKGLRVIRCHWNWHHSLDHTVCFFLSVYHCEYYLYCCTIFEIFDDAPRETGAGFSTVNIINRSGPVFLRHTVAWFDYPTVKIILKIYLFVLTEYTNVTDRRTDTQTPHDGIGRTCIASRGKMIL